MSSNEDIPFFNDVICNETKRFLSLKIWRLRKCFLTLHLNNITIKDTFGFGIPTLKRCRNSYFYCSMSEKYKE